MTAVHTSDGDCAPHLPPDDGTESTECPVCGVWHADPCATCGCRCYHAAGCAESDVGTAPRWWAWGEDNARLHATEIQSGDLHDWAYEPASDDEPLPSHALIVAARAA